MTQGGVLPQGLEQRVDLQPILQCRDLRKSYGERVAVNGVSFHIGVGETYGLLGPNGSGKTTTISMVCGLLAVDDGEVLVAGEPMHPDAIGPRRLIGYVPQDLAIYPDLSARENLRFFGRLYGLGGHVLAARIDEVLAATGLEERADDRTQDYSGGMKRRLNIGIGLLNDPRLLVLDEPTVGIDPQSRNVILTTVEELRDRGTAVLYTTHYMEEADRLCHRIGIIDEGRIQAEGTRRELVSLVGQRDKVLLTASGNLEAAQRALLALDEVEDATRHERGLDLLVRDARQALARTLAVASGAGSSITGVEVLEPDLEAVFLHLTGKALRD